MSQECKTARNAVGLAILMLTGLITILEIIN